MPPDDGGGLVADAIGLGGLSELGQLGEEAVESEGLAEHFEGLEAEVFGVGVFGEVQEDGEDLLDVEQAGVLGDGLLGVHWGDGSRTGVRLASWGWWWRAGGLGVDGAWCWWRRDTRGKRGYDGSVGVGMTEKEGGGMMGRLHAAVVLVTARYPRRGAGMTDLWAWV